MNYQEICHQYNKNRGRQQKLESQLKHIEYEMISAHQCGFRHLWANLNKQASQLRNELIQLQEQEFELFLAKKNFKKDSLETT